MDKLELNSYESVSYHNEFMPTDLNDWHFEKSGLEFQSFEIPKSDYQEIQRDLKSTNLNALLDKHELFADVVPTAATNIPLNQNIWQFLSLFERKRVSQKLQLISGEVWQGDFIAFLSDEINDELPSLNRAYLFLNDKQDQHADQKRTLMTVQAFEIKPAKTLKRDAVGGRETDEFLAYRIAHQSQDGRISSELFSIPDDKLEHFKHQLSDRGWKFIDGSRPDKTQFAGILRQQQSQQNLFGSFNRQLNSYTVTINRIPRGNHEL